MQMGLLPRNRDAGRSGKDGWQQLIEESFSDLLVDFKIHQQEMPFDKDVAVEDPPWSQGCTYWALCILSSPNPSLSLPTTVSRPVPPCGDSGEPLMPCLGRHVLAGGKLLSSCPL